MSQLCEKLVLWVIHQGRLKSSKLWRPATFLKFLIQKPDIILSNQQNKRTMMHRLVCIFDVQVQLKQLLWHSLPHIIHIDVSRTMAYMSRVMRKKAFHKGENKGTDQE